MGAYMAIYARRNTTVSIAWYWKADQSQTSSLPTTYDIAVSPQTVLLHVLNAQHTAGAQETRSGRQVIIGTTYPVHVGLATARPRSGGAIHALLTRGFWTCPPVNCMAPLGFGSFGVAILASVEKAGRAQCPPPYLDA